ERLCSWNGHPRAGLTIAVVSTSLGFGLTHEYQGDYAVLATGIYGLAFSGLFLLARRNLVPAMAAHATLDVLGLLAASR
ncbi:MAG: type II CAAX prenyl endopeptidase Rce1 family protein, partial [Planctomycetota bacterium]